MGDVYDKCKRSSVMKAVRSSDTKPELALRRALHRCGVRFRLHRRDLPGTPDMVLPGHRKVIFVHGCFWHQHPGCRHSARPASNLDYWNAKLDRNVVRDQANAEALRNAGWGVLVVWECQLRDLAAVVESVLAFLLE